VGESFPSVRHLKLEEMSKVADKDRRKAAKPAKKTKKELTERRQKKRAKGRPTDALLGH